MVEQQDLVWTFSERVRHLGRLYVLYSFEIDVMLNTNFCQRIHPREMITG